MFKDNLIKSIKMSHMMDKTIDDYEKKERKLNNKIRSLETDIFELKCQIENQKILQNKKIELFDDFMLSLLDFDSIREENKKLKQMLKDFARTGNTPTNFFDKV